MRVSRAHATNKCEIIERLLYWFICLDSVHYFLTTAVELLLIRAGNVGSLVK